MEHALELGKDAGEVYSELAYQYVMRAGMWQRRLDDSLVQDWISRAIAGSADGTPMRVRALVAQSIEGVDVDAARTALDLADRLGDEPLRFEAMAGLQSAFDDTGQLDKARAVAEERIALLPRIADPDRAADALFTTVDLLLNAGRISDARALTARLEETVAGLTPHHLVHGLGVRLILEDAVADWDTMRGYTQRTEEAIQANLATPCPFNRSLLIMLATAWIHAGGEAEASRLLARGDEVGMGTYLRMQTPRWIRLALARHDHAEIRRLIGEYPPDWLMPSLWGMWCSLLDGLAEVGDWDRIEADAPQWVGQETIIAPFAMRALALARGDEALLEAAATRFAAMSLDRHAQQTRAMRERFSSDSGRRIP
jgi:hypothetical protein